MICNICMCYLRCTWRKPVITSCPASWGFINMFSQTPLTWNLEVTQQRSMPFPAWLVVEPNPSEKNELVSWDYDLPNWMEKSSECSKPTSSSYIKPIRKVSIKTGLFHCHAWWRAKVYEGNKNRPHPAGLWAQAWELHIVDIWIPLNNGWFLPSHRTRHLVWQVDKDIIWCMHVYAIW